MPLLLLEGQPLADDIPDLKARGFAYNCYRIRWESKRFSRQQEQEVKNLFPHLSFRLSKPESYLLQLSPPTDLNRPDQFWLSSNIPTRNIPLETKWDKERPNESLQAARAEAAKVLGCQPQEVRPASALLVMVREGHKW